MKQLAFLLIIVGVIGMGFTAKGFLSRETLDGEQSFSGDRFDQIVLESGQADVNIIPSDSQDIKVSWKGSVMSGNERSRHDSISIEEVGSELNIQIGRQWFLNWSIFNINFSNRLEVTIYLPEKHYQSIVVKNNVGSTLIKDVSVDHLTAENDVARLVIEDVKAISIVAKNNVGQITLTNNEGELQVENDVGHILVTTDDITDDMNLLSNVGKIEVLIPFIPDDVTFNANSSVGQVRIFGEKGSYISREAKHVVTMSTEVGSITVDVRE